MADTTLQQHESFSQFVQTHQGLVIGGGVVAILVLAGMFMRSKQPSVPTSTTADLSGLPEGKIYVPTQTSFSTQNIKYGPQINSNDPNLTNVSGTQTVGGPTTTTTTTNNPPWRKPPVTGGHEPPPVPQPPRKDSKSLRWDQRYTVRGGKTLSSIAAARTRTLRAQGMPGNMTLTWHDLYAHNTAIINKYAQQHGYKSDYWNWIFPNETITVPRWG